MKQILDQALGVKIGAPATFQNMTVFPLMGGLGMAADYLTLDEALVQKLAPIRFLPGRRPRHSCAK